MAVSQAWVAGILLLVHVAVPGDLVAQTASVPTVRDRAFNDLRGALQRLGASEEAFRERERTYASTIWELTQQGDWSESEVDGTKVIVVDADDSSWTAAALSRALPGLRCILERRRSGEPVPEPTCTGNPDYLVLINLNPSPFEVELRTANRMAARCPSRITSKATGQVLIEFTLDTRGVPDFAGVHITDSKDIRLSYAAILMLNTCHFSPAEIDGHKVRSRRVSPFNIVTAE